MPTHPECLYYLYKGYTHEVHTRTYKYINICTCKCERNQNPLVIWKGYSVVMCR